MIKKNKLYLILLTFIFLASCGYEKINNKDIKVYEIIKISSDGEKRINYSIERAIKLNSSSSGLNKININFFTKKIKKTKEKNISNTITKYGITINTSIEVENTSKNKMFSRTISKEGFFQVGKTHSETMQSEKSTVKNLTDSIEEEIVNFLNINLKNQ